MKDCLTWPMWHTKNAFLREMQFWSHCYTVVSYQALIRLSLYKIPAVYLSGAKNVCFCTIRDFGSPTINMNQTPIQEKGIDTNSVKFLLVLSIYIKKIVVRRREKTLTK